MSLAPVCEVNILVLAKSSPYHDRLPDDDSPDDDRRWLRSLESEIGIVKGIRRWGGHV